MRHPSRKTNSFFKLNDTNEDPGIHARIDVGEWKRLLIQPPRKSAKCVTPEFQRASHRAASIEAPREPGRRGCHPGSGRGLMSDQKRGRATPRSSSAVHAPGKIGGESSHDCPFITSPLRPESNDQGTCGGYSGGTRRKSAAD